jgi:iron complex transport system substrate-binding protein
LDWGLASLAIELGVPPVGVAEQALYRVWVGEPALPPATAELGLRTMPSLEGLLLLRPDLILINPLNEALRPRLERIAPTFSNQTFTTEHAPLARSRETTRALGDRIGRADAAARLIAAADARIAAARDRLRPAMRQRALLPVALVDGRHFTVYGPGSLFDDVMAVLGMHTAFRGPTNAWGTAVGTIDGLVAGPPTDVAVLDPVPPDAARLIGKDGLLSRLLAATGTRSYRLPPAWAYGGVSAAAGFAERLVDALHDGAGQGS